MDNLKQIPRTIGYYKGQPVVVDFSIRKAIVDKLRTDKQPEVIDGQGN